MRDRTSRVVPEAARLRVVRHNGPGAFLDRAEPWLLRREAENTLILGVAASLVRGSEGDDEPSCRGAEGRHGPVYFATVELGGEVAGCAFRTPPCKLAVTRMPLEAASLLVLDVKEVYYSIPAVLGPAAVAREVAGAWAELVGVRAEAGARQRIHRLERVRFPSAMAPGRLRLAEPGDLPLASAWMKAFVRSTRLNAAADAEVLATRLIEGGLLALWVNPVPVSMASFPDRTRHTVRISHVYTPPEQRRRGYASALVAHIGRHILDSGFRECVLYTDLANRGANRLYRGLGYRPVQDVMDMNFVPHDRSA